MTSKNSFVRLGYLLITNKLIIHHTMELKMMFVIRVNLRLALNLELRIFEIDSNGDL